MDITIAQAPAPFDAISMKRSDYWARKEEQEPVAAG